MKNTINIRRVIPIILRNLGIKILLDIPCGDLYWMQKINLNGIYYIGADIFPEIIS